MDLSFFGQVMVSGIASGAIYAAVAMGFVLVFRVTGILNFAQGELLMVGGMLFITMRASGVPTALAALIAMAIVFLLGVVIYAIGIAPAVKRATHISLLLITLGFSQMLTGGAQMAWGERPRYTEAFTPGEPISILDITVTWQSVWALGGVCVALLITYIALEKTTVGRDLRAAAIDPMMARLSGIRVKRVSMIAFGVGAALAAVGGILLAPVIGMSYSTGAVLTIKGVAAAVIGGFGSIPGAIVGGLALGLVESWATVFSSGYQTSISMLVVLLVLLLLPNGLLGKRTNATAVGV